MAQKEEKKKMKDQVLARRLEVAKVIFVFLADIIPDKENGKITWRSARGLESDHTGPIFSYERVLAAAALWKQNPSLTLVLSGGQNGRYADQDPPDICSVVSEELQALGVPSKSIVEEPKASNTWTQVLECSALAEKMDLADEDCAILAPVWQFPRISALIRQGLSEGPLTSRELAFISMERALAAEDPEKWNARFEELYSSDLFQRSILVSEVMGSGQLLTGHQPKYPKPFKGFQDPLG